MPITIDLTRATPDSVVVQPSPLLELMAAMHVLTEADHHPDQVEAASGLRSALGEELVEQVHYYSPLWSRYRCRLFFVRGGASGSIDHYLDDLRMLPMPQFASLAAEGVLGMGRSANHQTLLADSESFIAACRQRSSARAELAERLVTDQEGLRRELLTFLENIWTTEFHNTWNDSFPQIAGAVERTRSRLGEGVVKTVAGLSPTSTTVGDGQRVRFDKLDTINFALDHKPLILVPSIFHSPHLTVKRTPTGELAVLFPAGTVQNELALDELRQRLQCFESPLRMGILRHLLGEPLSSSELSLRLGVEATQISRALSKLRSNEVIHSERSTGVIRHHADIEVIRRLGLDVLATIMR